MIEELAEKVDKKINKEYNSYLEDIKKLPLDQIIQIAYEIAVKEELTEMFYKESNHDKYQLMALLEQDNTLEFLYNAWINGGCGIRTLLENSLSDTFYNMKKEYEERINLKIRDNPNYNLIRSISNTLQSFDTSDFCYHIKNKYNIKDLDIYDVYSILQTKDGVKYLIDYFEEMKENDHLSYCIEIGVINYEDYDRIDGKILPGLSKLSKDQAKNNKNHNKISIDRGR